MTFQFPVSKFKLLAATVLLAACITVQATVSSTVTTAFKSLVTFFTDGASQFGPEVINTLDNIGFKLAELNALSSLETTTVVTLCNKPFIQLITPRIVKPTTMPANSAQGYVAMGSLIIEGEECTGEFFTIQMNDGTLYRGIGFQASQTNNLAEFTALVDVDASNHPSLQHIQLPAAHILFSQVPSSFSFATTSTIPVKVNTGVTLAAECNVLSGPFEAAARFVDKVRHTSSFKASGKPATIGVSFPLSGSILHGLIVEVDLPFEFGIDFDQLRSEGKISAFDEHFFKIRSIMMGDLTATFNPLKQQLALSGKTVLSIKSQLEPLTLSLEGDISPTQVSITAGMQGMWDPAFGISWLGLGNVNLKIIVDYAFEGVVLAMGIPFTGFGLAGEFSLGKEKEFDLMMEGLVSLESRGLPIIAFGTELEGDLNFSPLVEWFSRMAHKIDHDSSPTDTRNLPEIVLKKGSGIYFASESTQLGSTNVPQGFWGKFDAEIAHREAELQLIIDPETYLISGQVTMPPFKSTVISISNLTGKLTINGNKPANNLLGFTAKVEVPLIDLAVDVQEFILSSSCFDVGFTFTLANAFSTTVSLQVEPSHFEEFYLIMQFQQDFKAAIARELHALANVKIKDELEPKIQHLQASLDNVLQDERYSNFKQLLLYNEVVQQTNDQFKVCRADFKIVDIPAYALWEASHGKHGKPFPKSCEQFVEHGLLHILARIEKGFWEAETKIDDALHAVASEVEQINHELHVTQKLKEGYQEIAKIFEAVALGALDAINLKTAKIEVTGKDLKAGKSPMLSFELDIDLQVVPPIVFKENLQFDLKDIPASMHTVATAIMQKIEHPVESSVRELMEKIKEEEAHLLHHGAKWTMSKTICA